MKLIKKLPYRSRFSVHRRKRIDGVSIPLNNYQQQDYHSCGYLAALTVADYLVPNSCPKQLLSVVRPGINTGTSRGRVIKGLASVGIKAKYREDLTILNLIAYLIEKTPVIISVFPDWWNGDHWTVVQGVGNSRVYLTNHYSMTMEDFNREWIYNWGKQYLTGAGLVCERM